MNDATPYQECSALLGDGAALRAAARERGYLFFRARLPAAAVRAVRRDVLREIQRQGYLVPGTAWDDAVARPGTSLSAFDVHAEYKDHYNGLLRLRSFHALALHPNPAGGPGTADRRAAADAPAAHLCTNVDSAIPNDSLTCAAARIFLRRCVAALCIYLDRVTAAGRHCRARGGLGILG